MPLDGLGDAFKTGAAMALKEVADTNNVHVTGSTHPVPGKVGIQGVQFREPLDPDIGVKYYANVTDTRLSKIVPSGNAGDITYSFGLYTPEFKANTNVSSIGRREITAKPFPVANKIFSLENNNDFTSVERVESIATRFGEGWDYSILKASVPSVKDGDKDSTLYAELWTDLPGSSATDFMVGGWWLVAPNNPTGDYRFGALAQAENYYPRDGTGPVKAEVKDTATYKGPAAGLHTSSENGMVSIQRLLGKVTLTADFGTTAARGTIKGKINNLTLDGESTTGEILLPKVTLGTTFDSLRVPDTTNTNLNPKINVGNIDGINYMGDWAGTFLGDSSGNDQPTGIVGVVGGSGGGNSFVASFGAKKVENE